VALLVNTYILLIARVTCLRAVLRPYNMAMFSPVSPLLTMSDDRSHEIQFVGSARAPVAPDLPGNTAQQGQHLHPPAGSPDQGAAHVDRPTGWLASTAVATATPTATATLMQKTICPDHAMGSGSYELRSWPLPQQSSELEVCTGHVGKPAPT
jgi:septal ring-binding cell division protein DamX